MLTIDLTKGYTCASVQSREDLTSLTTEPCSGNKCTWFEGNTCTAVSSTADEFRKYYKADSAIPECSIASSCRWNHDALKNGDRACPPRSLGLVCEHQANDSNRDIAIWNTFDMADSDDAEAWTM